MKIGKLDKRITLQSRSATLDDYGQELNSWSDIATVWANVKPLGGREKLRAMAVESLLTHTVTVRYNVLFLPSSGCGRSTHSLRYTSRSSGYLISMRRKI